MLALPMDSLPSREGHRAHSSKLSQVFQVKMNSMMFCITSESLTNNNLNFRKTSTLTFSIRFAAVMDALQTLALCTLSHLHSLHKFKVFCLASGPFRKERYPPALHPINSNWNLCFDFILVFAEQGCICLHFSETQN